MFGSEVIEVNIGNSELVQEVAMGTGQGNHCIVTATLLDSKRAASLVSTSTMDTALVGGDLKSVKVPSPSATEISYELILLELYSQDISLRG